VRSRSERHYNTVSIGVNTNHCLPPANRVDSTQPMPIKLILFDLDGTLVDSSMDITKAVNHAFKLHGIAPVDVGETVTMVGEGPSRLIEKMLLKRGLSHDIEPLVKRWLDYYASHLAIHTVPYPGVVKTLRGLEAYRKAIVSNKPGALTEGVLKELKLSHHFDLVLGSDALPERKPLPGPILHVLERLACAPEESIIVGDSVIDIAAGKAAGIRTVAVTYGYGKAGFEREADFVIDRMGDLMGVLQGIA
jgi:phosphoglycolate phosphatase